MDVVEVGTEKRLASLTLRHRKYSLASEVLNIFLRERRRMRRQQNMPPDRVLSICA
jgi:hypothetical protein